MNTFKKKFELKEYKPVNRDGDEKMNTVCVMKNESDAEWNNKNFNNSNKTRRYIFVQIFCFMLKYVFSNILLYIGTMKYISTLEGCNIDDEKCKNTFHETKVKEIMKQIAISSLFFFANFAIAYLRIINRKNIIIQFTCIYVLCFKYDNGKNFQNHGHYNGLFLLYCYFAQIIVLIFIYSIFYSIYRCIRWKKLAIIPITLTLFSLVFFSPNIFQIYIDHSCDYWDVGFKNSKIDNNKSCHIKKPKICYEVLLNNIFDVSFWLMESCEIIGNNEKGPIQKYTNLKHNFSVIGYPRVENWSHNGECLESYFKSNVLKNIVDMDDKNKLNQKKENIEVTVNFTLTEPQVNIKAIRQDDVALEREKILK